MNFDYQQRLSTDVEDVPLGKLLEHLSMQSVFYTRSGLSAPWAISMPAMKNCIMFHLVIEGSMFFSVEQTSAYLEKGEFVMFPGGQGHIIADSETYSDATPLSQLPIKTVTPRYESLTFGGGRDTTSQLVCGALLFEHPLAIKLLSILPSFIAIKGQSNAARATVTGISELISIETQNPSAGCEAVLSRLADILVITAFRQYLAGLSDRSLGWLGALNDDRIGRAMTLIHNSPDKHWTLEQLAHNVGMSRTSFAIEFKRLVGNTPMDYLTEWRMSLAYSKLQMTKQTVLAIAIDLGYQSEAAFSRAYKKFTGQTPSETRKRFLS